MPSPQDFFNALGNLAAGLQAAPSGVPKRIWQELWPWVSQLAINAGPKWVPRLGFGFACHVPIYQGGVPTGACPRAAIAACDVCGEPVCIAHGRIDHLGDAICHLCIAEAMRAHKARGANVHNPTPGQQQPPRGGRNRQPVPAEDLTRARRILGVNRSASWDDVRSAHRKKSGKWHPDRHQGDAAKRDAEEKFKLVQWAFGLLKTEHEQEASA